MSSVTLVKRGKWFLVSEEKGAVEYFATAKEAVAYSKEILAMKREAKRLEKLNEQ